MRNRYLSRTLGVNNFGEGKPIRDRHETLLLEPLQFRCRVEFIGAFKRMEASVESLQRSSLLRKHFGFASKYLESRLEFDCPNFFHLIIKLIFKLTYLIIIN